jgi:hypothetical protein
VAEKSVRSHFFSAPIIELLRLVFQLLFVGAYMGIGSNQPNWGCGYGGAGVFGPVRILVLASLVINREEIYTRAERLRCSSNRLRCAFTSTTVRQKSVSLENKLPAMAVNSASQLGLGFRG